MTANTWVNAAIVAVILLGIPLRRWALQPRVSMETNTLICILWIVAVAALTLASLALAD